MHSSSLVGQFENSAGSSKLEAKREKKIGKIAMEDCFISRTAPAEAGLPWEEVESLRREKLNDFQDAVTSVFRELCDKMNINDKR